MNLFLAGAITGNLINKFKEIMELYLASAATDSRMGYKENMDLFIAGVGQGHGGVVGKQDIIPLSDFYALESFFYIEKHEWLLPLIPKFKGFLLDSGAFTFMVANKNTVDWDSYVDRYAKFIIKNDIKLFFELDIDLLVGINEVERLRRKLEKKTGKKSIPVWHKSRGLPYWEKMVKDYSYVAIGGIVTQEIKRSQYGIFSYLLEIAKKNKCKVHGLGFTNLIGMTKYKFDSVDSTAWLSGNKFGHVYLFNGKTMEKILKSDGKKVKANKVAFHNFKEWVKFSKYAEEFL